jgi:hypothetical protein
LGQDFGFVRAKDCDQVGQHDEFLVTRWLVTGDVTASKTRIGMEHDGTSKNGHLNHLSNKIRSEWFQDLLSFHHVGSYVEQQFCWWFTQDLPMRNPGDVWQTR